MHRLATAICPSRLRRTKRIDLLQPITSCRALHSNAKGLQAYLTRRRRGKPRHEGRERLITSRGTSFIEVTSSCMERQAYVRVRVSSSSSALVW